MYERSLTKQIFLPNLGNGKFCVVSTPKSERERESGRWVEKPPFVVLKKCTALLCSPFLWITLSLGGDAACDGKSMSASLSRWLALDVCARFLIFYIVFQWAALSFLSRGFLIDAVLDNLWHSRCEFFGAMRARELMKCAARRPERPIILCVGE